MKEGVPIPPLLETRVEANLQEVKQMSMSIPKLSGETKEMKKYINKYKYVLPSRRGV